LPSSQRTRSPTWPPRPATPRRSPETPPRKPSTVSMRFGHVNAGSPQPSSPIFRPIPERRPQSPGEPVGASTGGPPDRHETLVPVREKLGRPDTDSSRSHGPEAPSGWRSCALPSTPGRPSLQHPRKPGRAVLRISVSEAVRSLEDRGLVKRQKTDQSGLVIDRARELLGRPLPADLIDLYREHIARVGEFAGIAPRWNDRVGWSKDVVSVTDLLHANAVPLFDDGCGNLYGLDLSSEGQSPAVYFFDHEREFDRPRYAAGSSLGAFLLLLGEEDQAYREGRPAGWQLAIDPDLDKCPRAPPAWRAG
jgi:hypothetical protein